MFGTLTRVPLKRGARTVSSPSISWLTRLRQHPRSPRFLIVVLASAVIAIMTYSASLPLPFRVGEIPARGLRVRVPFIVVTEPQSEWASEDCDRPTPTVEQFPAGVLLAKAGEPISERQLTLLRREHRAYRDSLTWESRLARGTAIFLTVTLLAVVIVLYVARFQPGIAADCRRVAGISALVVATLGLALLLARAPWYAIMAPMTVTAMVLTIAYNPPFALLMSFSLALVTSLALGAKLEILLIQLAGLATSVLLLRNVTSRSRLVRVGLEAALACAAMTIATGILGGQTASFISAEAGRNFLWCALGGFILCGALPVVEFAFGIVTDVSLVELANSSHPLLQELIRRAPGTYTHSMTVATLAEAAAKAVGANVLLARVGSYFHDVGKMLKPDYFVENQDDVNRHDELEPGLSTLVIVGHVKDGMALAEQYRLPKLVADLIQQHHGTTLVEYFYREALRLHGREPTPALEATFRYPGPKPQSREAGILMLADAAESASRALTAPTPNSLRKLVHDLTMRRLLDGQFDDSGLTLTDLYRIEESLSKGLIALFHSRIRYPDAPSRKAG